MSAIGTACTYNYIVLRSPKSGIPPLMGGVVRVWISLREFAGIKMAWYRGVLCFYLGDARMLKKFILCAVAAVSAFSTTARGQCSSWDTIQDIAVAMAPNPIVIDAVLDNNETFNLYVDLFTGDVAAFTDSTGVGPSSGWTEDEFGTGTMTSTDLSLVFECDGSGGLLVTVSGTGFSPETFGVTSAGMLALDYRQAVNGGSAPGGKIYCTVPCPAGTWTSNSQCYSGQTCCGYVDCNSVLGPGSGTSNMNCCGSSQVCQGSPRSRHCVAVTP